MPTTLTVLRVLSVAFASFLEIGLPSLTATLSASPTTLRSVDCSLTAASQASVVSQAAASSTAVNKSHVLLFSSSSSGHIIVNCTTDGQLIRCQCVCI